MKPSQIWTALALATLAPAASADLLVGRVVDSLGVGVALVDIDVKNLSGGPDPPIFNDGTNWNGDFAVTVPPGLYRVIFIPPPPPVTTHLKQKVDNVVVLGTTNMGTVVLPPGVAVSGHVVNSATWFPVAGVNLDVVDLGTGDQVDISADRTDAFGNFAVAVPETDIELRFNTSPVPFPLLASTAMELSLSGNLALGDVPLQPGFTVGGRILRSGSMMPVVNADLDVFPADTAQELYTPGDHTDASGSFTMVLAAGLYDIEICPRFSDLLVATDLSNVVVTTTLSLGDILLDAGAILSGTVRAFDGSIVPGADVDAIDPATGLEYTLCGDNADSQGNYSVVVPMGWVDFRYTPPFLFLLGSQLVTGTFVGGPTVIDAVLPSCPPGSNYGAGTAGTGGMVPHLTSSGGAPRVGNTHWTYELQDGRGSALAILGISLGQSSFPFLGGTVLIDLTRMVATVPLALGGAPGAPGVGSASFLFPVPILPIHVGATIYNQFVVLDPAAPGGFAMSEGLSVTFCD